VDEGEEERKQAQEGAIVTGGKGRRAGYCQHGSKFPRSQARKRITHRDMTGEDKKVETVLTVLDL